LAFAGFPSKASGAVPMGRVAVAMFAAGGFGAGGGFPLGGGGGACCNGFGPYTVAGAGGGFPLGGGGACGVGADICDATGGAKEGGMELV
jgi:hypothetical protein